MRGGGGQWGTPYGTEGRDNKGFLLGGVVLTVFGAACLSAPTVLLGGERGEVPEGRCRGTAVEGSGCRQCWERNEAAGGEGGSRGRTQTAAPRFQRPEMIS